MNNSQIRKRKEAHIKLAKDENSQMKVNNNGKQYTYTALPEINLNDVSTEVKLFSKRLSQPLIIASMTGGSDHAININRNIAIAAQELKIAYGVGSQRITIADNESKKSFSLVREYAPDAFIFANIGAVQLNYGVGIAEIQKVIDLIKADALYLHLNPLQEAIQPEGDTNFADLLRKMKSLIDQVSVPVFVKEVGHGISLDTAKSLYNIGVKNIDVAGTGGTSWAWIEGKRAQNDRLGDWFKDYGIPTQECVASISKEKPTNSILVASGGIRSPVQGLEMIKLGADYYSAAYPFLDAAMNEKPDILIKQLKDWQKGLKIAMFVHGMKELPVRSAGMKFSAKLPSDVSLRENGGKPRM